MKESFNYTVQVTNNNVSVTVQVPSQMIIVGPIGYDTIRKGLALSIQQLEEKLKQYGDNIADAGDNSGNTHKASHTAV